MSNRPTPKTDNLFPWIDFARIVTDEMIQSKRKLREAREDAEHWKTEYEIVEYRLRGKKHQRDNGIMAEDEIIPKLTRERDEAREAFVIATDQMVIAQGKVREANKERDEAQKELSCIHRWIERNHADGFIDSLTYFQNLDRITENWYDRLDRLEIDAGRFERERDKAQVQIKELIYISERAIALAEIDFENDKFGVVSELRDGVERIKEARNENRLR